MQRMDLNLLVAFDALVSQGSVSAASRRMGLSVPAMSRTLTRIRAVLGDQVLVRAGRRMIPTPHALRLKGQVQDVLEQIQRVLSPAQLDLAHTHRSFTIRCNETVAGTIAARLAELVAARAPGISLCFAPEGDEDVEALRDGRVHLQIGPRMRKGPELRTRKLLRERFVAVVRADHPLGQQPMTLQAYLRTRHVSASRHGRLHGPIDTMLEQRGLARSIALIVASHSAAAMVAAGSDLVATIPSRLAARLASLGLRIRSYPLPLETGLVDIALAWHPCFDADPVHRWLREQVVAVFIPSLPDREARADVDPVAKSPKSPHR
jgi:DNA-binding transcriptional LysR family regulator